MNKLKIYAIVVMLVGFAAFLAFIVIFFIYESHGKDLMEESTPMVTEAIPAICLMIGLTITFVVLITCNACIYSSLEPQKKSEKK